MGQTRHGPQKFEAKTTLWPGQFFRGFIRVRSSLLGRRVSKDNGALAEWFGMEGSI